MKELIFTAAKWVAAIGILTVIGVMMIMRLGRKRGTRSCRCRVAMWGVVVSLVGTALSGTSCVPLFVDTESCYGFCPADDISDKYLDVEDALLTVPSEKKADIGYPPKPADGPQAEP